VPEATRVIMTKVFKLIPLRENLTVEFSYRDKYLAD